MLIRQCTVRMSRDRITTTCTCCACVAVSDRGGGGGPQEGSVCNGTPQVEAVEGFTNKFFGTLLSNVG